MLGWGGQALVWGHVVEDANKLKWGRDLTTCKIVRECGRELVEHKVDPRKLNFSANSFQIFASELLQSWA